MSYTELSFGMDFNTQLRSVFAILCFKSVWALQDCNLTSVKCEPGIFSVCDNGRASCKECEAGKYRDAGTRKCENWYDCSGEGQITCFKGNKTHDRTCKCNTSAGYNYSSTWNKECFDRNDKLVTCSISPTVQVSTQSSTTKSSQLEPWKLALIIIFTIVAVAVVVLISLIVCFKKGYCCFRRCPLRNKSREPGIRCEQGYCCFRRCPLRKKSTILLPPSRQPYIRSEQGMALQPTSKQPEIRSEQGMALQPTSKQPEIRSEQATVLKDFPDNLILSFSKILTVHLATELVLEKDFLDFVTIQNIVFDHRNSVEIICEMLKRCRQKVADGKELCKMFCNGLEKLGNKETALKFEEMCRPFVGSLRTEGGSITE